MEPGSLRNPPGVVVALALALILPAIAAAQTSQQRVQAVAPARLQQAALAVTWDFETGDLRGWTPTGDAFSAQPTHGDNTRLRGRETANHQGDYWVGTYERHPRPGPVTAASVQGDEPQGTLTSTPFTIPDGDLSFLVGGGAAFETRVELRILDPIEGSVRALYASGQNSETMRRQVWDLSRFAGRRGVIRVVDESSDRWGHINVDDFRFPAIITDVLPVDPDVFRPPPELERPPEQDRRPQEETTRVPYVVGRSLEVAVALLQRARLVVGEVGRTPSARPPGTVLAQEPEARSEVPLRTPVSLMVAVTQEEGPPDELGPRPVRVPDLSGRTEPVARQLLERSGLAVGGVRSLPSQSPRGTVIDQRPPPGTVVEAGTAVSFAIAEPETVMVPGLVGRSIDGARAILEGLRLVGRVAGERESDEPAGTVVAQRPGPGARLPVSGTVELAVAVPRTVAVPRLVGGDDREARRLLQEAELAVGPVQRQESEAPAGRVLAQSVDPGARLEVGSQVGFTVATPITVLVPDLVGRPETGARRLLVEAGLAVGNVRYEESRQPSSSVITQRNPAGSRVEIGTPVDLVVAIPVTVEVPDLVGRSREAASGLLEGVELGVGVVTSRESRQPVDTVLDQSPEPGTPLAIDSTVDLVVAEPVTVGVPELVGRSESEARGLLTDAELGVGAIRRRESRQPEDSVLAQGIEAGSRVVVGTAVDLDVAVPVTVLVPELVGAGEEEARARLSAAELTPGEIQDQESSATPGTVLAQGFNPGSLVPIGTAVSMVVAVVETVEVPRVVELPVEEARRQLVVGRLEVGVEEERESREVEAGVVLEQGRPPGSQAAVGTPISLVVATPEMVTVPEVLGMSEEEAAATIAAAGLVVGGLAEQISLQRGGTVLSQGQEPGSQVVFGTAVGLEVARDRVAWAAPVGLLLAAIVAVGGLRLRASRRRGSGPSPRRPRPPEEPPELPKLRLRPVPDPGSQAMERERGEGPCLEVRLDPAVDRGSQRLHAETGLIVGETRRESAPDDERSDDD